MCSATRLKTSSCPGSSANELWPQRRSGLSGPGRHIHTNTPLRSFSYPTGDKYSSFYCRACVSQRLNKLFSSLQTLMHFFFFWEGGVCYDLIWSTCAHLRLRVCGMTRCLMTLSSSVLSLSWFLWDEGDRTKPVTNARRHIRHDVGPLRSAASSSPLHCAGTVAAPAPRRCPRKHNQKGVIILQDVKKEDLPVGASLLVFLALTDPVPPAHHTFCSSRRPADRLAAYLRHLELEAKREESHSPPHRPSATYRMSSKLVSEL